MAKDDYYVIVYKILAYLYVQLKSGEPVDGSYISANGKLFEINSKYHSYIISNLVNDGYITSPSIKTWGGETIIDLSSCEITPKGIDYLFENSFIEKAKQFLKDIKEITPFI